jgi:energy-coupling factor transporter ATP-binding protein EcfA2
MPGRIDLSNMSNEIYHVIKNEARSVIENTDSSLEINHSNEKKIGYEDWIVGANNQFIPTPKITTIKKLIPGKYSIKWNDEYSRYCFVRESVNLDELLYLPNPVLEKIITDIDYFWDHKDLFEKYKFAYKRGILLYGKPGCGKSSITALLSEQVIAKGGIVLSVNNQDALHVYYNSIASIFRFIEPDTRILTIFEDLDGLVRNSETETVLLNILDGMNQSENVVNIGCTNYPENLKERILNRPSRFDKRYNIGLPDAKVRKFYLEHKINEEDLKIIGGNSFDDIVSKTEGLTLAHLGELIKSVFIFGNSLDNTLKTLTDMSLTISSSNDENRKKIGLNR